MLCAVRVFDPSRTVALAQARGSVQVGAGGDLQAALDSANAGRRHRAAERARRSPGTSCCPQKSGTRYITIRTAAVRRPAEGRRAHRPGAQPAGSRGCSRRTGRRRCAPPPGAHHWRAHAPRIRAESGAAPATSWCSATAPPRNRASTGCRTICVVDRCYIHGDPGARPEARHRAEQRVDDHHRVVHLRHQVRRARTRRRSPAGTVRAVPDREQLPRSVRRELHARRRDAGRSTASSRRTSCSGGITCTRPVVVARPRRGSSRTSSS